MSTNITYQPNQCPVCGQANQCAVAAGRPPEQCWCQAATIAPEVLNTIPAAALNKYCICERCATNAGDPQLER